MSNPTIAKVQKRKSNLNQQFYNVTYSHGITTILDKDGDIIKEWVAAGNTVEASD